METASKILMRLHDLWEKARYLEWAKVEYLRRKESPKKIKSLEIQYKNTAKNIEHLFNKVNSLFNESFLLQVKYELITKEGSIVIQRIIPNVTEKEFREWALFAILAKRKETYNIHILEIQEIRDLIKQVPL